MQHVEALYAVLQEYLAAYTLPNFSEFLGIYGRVSLGFPFLFINLKTGYSRPAKSKMIDHLQYMEKIISRKIIL
jgi:hypothetical protein